jgi:hypothetical protein
LISARSPASISAPNPPFRLGHRNAIDAPPNCAPKTRSDEINDLRKKSRRETAVTRDPGGGRPAARACDAARASCCRW